MKIIVTGGHFTPAYAVIKKIKDHEVTVIGRRYAFENDNNETYEYKVCKSEGIPFINLQTGRLQRKLTSQTIPSILKFPKGVMQSLAILREEKPDVVVTFGGYIGLPVCIAASILKIPIVLHEQTQKAGLTTRLISRIAKVVCISFKSSEKYIKAKSIVLTGNPLREEIFEKQKSPFSHPLPLLYITGGSTGSHAINECVRDVLPRLLSEFTVVHQTGNSQEFADFDNLLILKKSLKPEFQERYHIKEFFNTNEVMYFFQNAAITVSRAGINTVLELMASGCVSILIPLPTGKKNEQKDNALLFESTGLGKMIEQKNLSSEVLLRSIHAMIKELESYKKNATNANRYIHKNAAEKIVEQIEFYGRSARKRNPQEEKTGLAF